MPFQDLTPISEKDLNLTPIGSNDLFLQAATPTDEEPWYTSLWNKATKPLSTFVGDTIDSWTGPQLPAGLQWGRIAQAGGDIIDSLTSPLNLSTAALSGGTSLAAKAGMPAVANAANMGVKALSAPVAAHGAINVVHPDSTLMERGTGLLELVGGGAGMASKVPSSAKFPSAKPLSKVNDVVDNLPLNTADNIPERTGKWDLDETGKPFHVVDESIPSVKLGVAEELTPINEAELVAPKPTTIKLKKPTEEMIAKANNNGYVLDSVDEQGRAIMVLKQVDDVPTPTKELSFEDEVIEKVKAIHNTSDGKGTLTLQELWPLEDLGPAKVRLNSIDNTAKNILKAGRDADTGGQFTLGELIDDIADNGLKESIKIRQSPDGTYQIIDGKHRLAALESLDWDQPIPVEVSGKDFIPGTKSNAAIASKVSEPIKAELPRDLKGAKPRFNIGTNSYTPEFESDLDKALFIISQKNPSKRDADYLKFVMDTLGVDESAAREMGKIVRTRIKNVLKGQEPGTVTIPASDNLTPTNVGPAKVTANTLKPTVGDDFTRALEASAKPKSPQQILNEEALAARRAGNNQPPNKPPDDIAQATGGDVPNNNPKQQLIDSLPSEDKPSLAAEIWNFTRGVMPAGDLTSIAFRQARPLMFTKAWWKSWNNTVKSFGSEAAFNEARQWLENHPLIKPSIPVVKNGKPVLNADGTPKLISKAEELGLSLTDIKGVNREETRIASTWPETKLGPYSSVIKASNRAASTFANEVRVRALDQMLKSAEKMGLGNNLPVEKDIAKLINDMSGRGSLAVKLGGREFSAERYANLANTWLFSPRLASAQARMYNRWFNPLSYMNENPVVRQEKLKGLLAVGSFWSGLASLGKLSGAEVSLNPTSSDFGKIKVGNLRMDVGGGMQQWLVAAARLAMGESTSSTSGKTKAFGSDPFAASAGSVIGEFAYNKLHPSARFALDLMRASNWTGDKGYRSMDLTSPNPFENDLAKQFQFMVMQDLYNVAKEDPSLLPLLAPGIITGAISTQSYGK